MQVRFGELARTELSEARTYLESQQPGLGRRFNQDVREAVTRIARMPLLYAVEVGDARKCLLHRFPYSLRYVIREEVIYIVAISPNIGSRITGSNESKSYDLAPTIGK